MSYQHRKVGLLRAGIIVFVLASCLRAWVGSVPVLATARAQIPDSGLQRKQVIEASRRTNELLTEIKQLLATGTFNVRIVGADNTSTDKKAGRPAKRR